MLAAMAKLPPAERRVLVMVHDGFTTSEIAKQLEMTEGTVRQNRSRALRRLKGVLGPAATQDDPGRGEKGASK